MVVYKPFNQYVDGLTADPSPTLDGLATHGTRGGVSRKYTGTAIADLIRADWPINLAVYGASPDNERAANTTAIQAGLDAARDQGRSWYLPPGDYKTGPVVAYTTGRGDGRLLFDNNPDYEYGFLVAPIDEDVIDLDLAFVNSLNIERGGSGLSELAPYYGYSIYLSNLGDEVPILRIGTTAPDSSGAIRWVEPFIVCNPDGQIYPPFRNTKTVATWTAMASRAVKIREPVIIEGVKIVVEDEGAGGMVACHSTERPNVIYRGCSVENLSSNEVLQGFIAGNGGNVIRYDNCHVNGLEIINTNYAFASAACDIRLTGCTETYCRRALDGTGAKLITADQCSFPDGVGAHWGNGIHISKSYLSSRVTNTAPIHAAGGDVSVDDCEIVVRSDQYTLMSMRADLMELRGEFSCTNSTITFDCTDNVDVDRYIFNMDFVPSSIGHDFGRTLYFPDNIKFEGNTVIQKGADFTKRMFILALAGGSTGQAGSDGISAGGQVTVRGNSWKFDSPLLSDDGNQKLGIRMYKRLGRWDKGGSYKVVLEDLPCLYTYLFCASDVADLETPRCDFYIDRVDDLAWGANYGIFREAKLGAIDYTLKLGSGRPAGGNTTAVGDENEIKTGDLYFFKGFNFGSLADGATASTTFSGCAGVTVGDSITAKFRGVAIGWFVEAACLTNEVISVMVMNKTGGTVDPPTTGLDIFVRRT